MGALPQVSQFVVERLGWTLLHSLWQWQAVGFAGWIILAILRRSNPRTRYVACVTLLAMGTLGPFVTYFLVSPARTENLRAPGEPSASIGMAGAPISPNDPNARKSPIDSTANARLYRSASPNDALQSSAMSLPAREVPSREWHYRLRQWLPTLVASWFVGVVLLSIRLGATWLGVQRLVRKNATPIVGSLKEAADRICDRLRIPAARLLESVEVQVPIAVGWLRPLVLVPTSVVVGLPAAQVQALLAHELAHLSRRDYLVNLAQSVVEIVFFYHPVVWWLSHKIRSEREEACDDVAVSVIGDSMLYAQALTTLATHHSEKPRVAIAASGGHLFRRIERLVLPTKGRPPQSLTSAWMVGLLIAASAPIAAASGPGLIAKLQARSPTKGNTSDETSVADQAPTTGAALRPSGTILPGTTPLGADWMETPAFGGTVVGADQQPVDSAAVFLRLRSGATDGSTGEPVFSAAVTKVACVGGRFHFPATRVPNPEKRFGAPYGFDVVAVHKGSAIGWRHILDPGPVEIKLRPEFVLHGRVTSGGGAVGQATVSVVRVVTKGELAWKAADFSHQVRTWEPGTIELGGTLRALTNANGEFDLAGLPREVGVVLEIEHPGFVRQRVYAVTTNLDPSALQQDLEERVHPRHNPQPAWWATRAYNEIRPNDIATNPVSVTLRPGIDVEVRVVDEKTRAPIANAELPKWPWLWGPGSLQFSDARGITRYENFTPGRITLRVGPPAKSEYLGAVQSFELTKDDRNRIETVGLPKGILVSGSVVDRQTRKGVGGATVYFVADKPEPTKPSSASPKATNSIVVGMFQTAAVDASGIFRIAIPAVPGQLILVGHVRGYRSYAQSGSVLDAPAEFHRTVKTEPGRPIDNVLFELDRAPELVWHVVDPDGKPVAGADIKATVMWRDASLRGTSMENFDAISDERGQVRLNDLFGQAKASRAETMSVDLTFEHRKRRLGARLALQPNEAKPIVREIRLERLGCVAMRVVDRVTRKGVPNVRIVVCRRASDPFERTSRAIDEPLFTDADGMFVFDRVLPGVEHSLAIIQPSPSNSSNPNQKTHNRGPILAAFVVAPGTTRNLGIVQLTTDAQPPQTTIVEVKSPDVSGLEANVAYESLLRHYDLDFANFRRRLASTSRDDDRTTIVAAEEPTAAYAREFFKVGENPAEPSAACRALVWIVHSQRIAGADSDGPWMERLRRDAARLLLERYSQRPELAEAAAAILHWGLPETGATPAAAESLVGQIEKTTSDHSVQGKFYCALADWYRAASEVESRPATKEELGRRIELCKILRDRYRAVEGPYGRSTMGTWADRELFEMQNLNIGQIAPEIRGTDLDGKPMALSELRGKIVVLAFSWSSPSPQLAKAFEEFKRDLQKSNIQGVVIVGVCNDRTREAAASKAKSIPTTFRSWYDGIEGPIAAQWNIRAWPTIYVIDAKGTIRFKNLRGVSEAGPAVQSLLAKDRT